MRRLSLAWLAQIRHLPCSDEKWSYSRPVDQDDSRQGWKLHVSATLLSAAAVFARTEPILRKNNTLFKVPRDLELLKLLNAGLPEFSQIGKFLTIYPRSTSEAVELAKELHRVTRGLHGPRVPFDARYRRNSLVHYRYGSFHSAVDGEPGFIHKPRGQRYRDKRAPGHAVPQWLQNPFPKLEAKSQKKSLLIRRRLLVIRALAQRGKGGVYESLDLSVVPARRVILKEGRKHGETNWDGRDGFALIKNEGHVLRKLWGTGLPVPEVLREFVDEGNRYLVLEKIKGRPLISAKRRKSAKLSSRRTERIVKQLAAILSKMHGAGWVWRDCKPSHILMNQGQLRLIDFEGACRVNETKINPWGSVDYSPVEYQTRYSRRAGTIEDDYALGVVAFQLLSGQFPPASVQHCSSIYRATRCSDSLRSTIDELLRNR